MESNFLFIQPSILTGIARTLDLFAILDEYNGSDSAVEADYVALLLDNYAVKRDLMSAILDAQKEIRIRGMLERSEILEANTLE